MNLRFAENKLYVEIVFNSLDIESITYEKILSYLKEKGINGLKTDYIFDLVHKAQAGVYYRVAEGVAPIEGESTSFVLYFKNELRAERPKEREDGSVDHRDLGYVIPVRKGEKLIDVVPPTTGTDGVDVFGGTIEAEHGKDVSIILGANTAISTEGLEIYSTADGVASLYNMEVKVEKSLVISSDIDYAVGNIFFPGDITILGSVIDGFKVISEGNIFISRDVINATIETKGSVVIQGTVNNKGGGYIKAGENIEVTAVQFGNLTAGNKICVEKEVRYSTLTANKQIIIDQEKSYIVGGRLTCFGRITVYDLGSKVDASKMSVILSENIQLLKRLKDIADIIKENSEEMIHIDSEVKNMEQYLASPQLTSEEFHEFEKIFEEFIQRKKNMERRNQELSQEKMHIINNLKDKDKPTLVVKNSLYPGVILEFPSKKLEITSEKRAVMIFEEANIIKFRPYNAS